MLFHLLAVLSLFANPASCQISVPVSVVTPPGAQLISPSLVSLSIELDRWTDWSGTTSRNQFFYNTLDNLGEITGEPPRLRIGGDTEDRTNYSPTLKFATATFDPPTAVTPYPEGSNVILGHEFYQTAQYLPPNTHLTWGVNYKNDNITNLYLSAKALLEAFASPAIKDAGITLDYIEIGNEVAMGAPPRGVSSMADYVQRWTTYASNISESFGIPSSSSVTKFWAGAFSGTTHTTTGMSPQGLFANGILSSAAGSQITGFSQHHYEGGFCAGVAGLLQNLMDKNLIRSNLTALKPDITAVRQQGLEYLLGETNSDACHGTPGVSNVGGAALWTLDHALFASQLGITRLYFHEGIGFKYNLIQPIALNISTLDGTTLPTPLPPHVQPQYYGAVIAAEAIGKSGKTYAVELDINDERVSGYAFYVGGTLARVVLINSLTYLTGTSTPRPSTLVSLDLSGSHAPTQMTIKRLAVPFADSTSGLKWGGQTYETVDGRVAGDLVVTTVNATASVVIHATEVVLLSFL